METTAEQSENKIRSEEEVNKMIELMRSNTLEGRTAKLLDIADPAEYIEEIRQMMCVYVASKDFKRMTKSGKVGFIWKTTNLLEYIARLDQK